MPPPYFVEFFRFSIEIVSHEVYNVKVDLRKFRGGFAELCARSCIVLSICLM